MFWLGLMAGIIATVIVVVCFLLWLDYATGPHYDD